MDIKAYIKTRSVGFWIAAGISAAALLAGVVYCACYASTDDFSVGVTVLLFVTAALFCVSFTKARAVLPYVQLVTVLCAVGFFAYSIYYYVSVVIVGIDLDSFGAEFIVCTILFALLTLAACVNVFFKQGEKSQNGEIDKITETDEKGEKAEIDEITEIDEKGESVAMPQDAKEQAHEDN